MSGGARFDACAASPLETPLLPPGSRPPLFLCSPKKSGLSLDVGASFSSFKGVSRIRFGSVCCCRNNPLPLGKIYLKHLFLGGFFNEIVCLVVHACEGFFLVVFCDDV